MGRGCGSWLGAAPTPLTPPHGAFLGKASERRWENKQQVPGVLSTASECLQGGETGTVPSPSPIPARRRGGTKQRLTIWARQRQAAWSKSQSWRMGEQPAMARVAGSKQRWPRLAALRYGSSLDCTAGHRRRRRGLINMEQWDEGRRAAPAPRPPAQVSPWLFWAVQPDSDGGFGMRVAGDLAQWWRGIWHEWHKGVLMQTRGWERRGRAGGCC